MVSVSIESEDEVEQRLLQVIKLAELKVYDGVYVFEEFGLDDFPNAVSASALALVRDDETWSQLVPAGEEAGEAFGLFRFHFPQGIDNSGFVGWLASRLKREFGTGVFVTCGQNNCRGGVYDYWGVPLAVASAAIVAVRELCRAGD